MTPPDFIIAGAMRAGSTALADALGEHPEIFMTTPKEPSFFALGSGALDFDGPGDQWFAQQHPRDWDSYQRLFGGAGEAVTGEASAMYLALPGVAARIVEHRPDAKVVLVLRDPVARSYSAWQYLRGRGREPLGDFREGLAAEEGRRRSDYGPMWWYVEASRYHERLQEFYDCFGTRSVLVIATESLRADPGGTMHRVYCFLGVEPLEGPPTALAREVNGGGVLRSPWLGRALYPSDRLRRVAAAASPAPVRRLVRQARASALRRPGAMSDESRAYLMDRLRDVPQAVSRMTGLDTTGWMPSAPEE